MKELFKHIKGLLTNCLHGKAAELCLAELCKMRINFKKSSVMWFRASSRSVGILYPPISIDGVELTVTTKQKYLGFIFDCT